MARAWIEGPMTGRWGPDQAALTRWRRWDGGYEFAKLVSVAGDGSYLAVRGRPGTAPDPAEFGAAPAATSGGTRAP